MKRLPLQGLTLSIRRICHLELSCGEYPLQGLTLPARRQCHLELSCGRSSPSVPHSPKKTMSSGVVMWRVSLWRSPFQDLTLLARRQCHLELSCGMSSPPGSHRKTMSSGDVLWRSPLQGLTLPIRRQCHLELSCEVSPSGPHTPPKKKVLSAPVSSNHFTIAIC